MPNLLGWGFIYTNLTRADKKATNASIMSCRDCAAGVCVPRS